MSAGLFAIIWSIAIIGWFVVAEFRFGNRFRAMIVTWAGGRALRGFFTTTALYLVVSGLSVLIAVRAVVSPEGDALTIGLWMIGTIVLLPVSLFALNRGGMISSVGMPERIPRRLAAAINIPAFLLGLVSLMALMASGFAQFAR